MSLAYEADASEKNFKAIHNYVQGMSGGSPQRHRHCHCYCTETSLCFFLRGGVGLRGAAYGTAPASLNTVQSCKTGHFPSSSSCGLVLLGKKQHAGKAHLQRRDLHNLSDP